MANTISKLAADVGLKADTVRYYERIGLLPEPERTPGNYRLYDSGAADRLRFIKSGQRLGLKLTEIRELLDIKDTGLCPCGHTANLLQKRIAALDEELQRLSSLRAELAAMVETRPGTQSRDGVRWHCSGEVIPGPNRLSDWLCSGEAGCRATPAREVETEKEVKNG